MLLFEINFYFQNILLYFFQITFQAWWFRFCLLWFQLFNYKLQILIFFFFHFQLLLKIFYDDLIFNYLLLMQLIFIIFIFSICNYFFRGINDIILRVLTVLHYYIIIINNLVSVLYLIKIRYLKFHLLQLISQFFNNIIQMVILLVENGVLHLLLIFLLLIQIC